MSLLIVAIISLLEAAVIAGAVIYFQRSRAGDGDDALSSLREALEERKNLKASLEEAYSKLMPFADLKDKLDSMRSVRDQLKVERGRVTITYAELETIEGRLRELHEIERELKASGLETQEELRILQQKEKELRDKNDALKSKLQESLAQLEELTGELEISAQMQAQIDRMKNELISTQAKIDQLLIQIEEGNQLYVKMKRRYDALDIEYAQLYEKFAETPIAN